jgi:hypothetical protein
VSGSSFVQRTSGRCVISSLEVVLKEGAEQDDPLIQFELPYSFNIVSKLPPRPRSQAGDIDVDVVVPPPPKPRRTGSIQYYQAVNAADDEGAADGRDLVIEKVVPNRGPKTGGPEICIWGSNFPTNHMPLYARFGDNSARAASMLSPSFGLYLIASSFLKCLTCSCAISRMLVFQAQLQ